MNYTFKWEASQKERDSLIKSYTDALSIIHSFIVVNHLPEIDLNTLIDEVIIFHKHSDFVKILTSQLLMKKADILPSYVGTIHQRKLYIMSKNFYFDRYTGVTEVYGYEKLIAHELAHAYHIQLLDGDEQSMGPVWFYEGFAIFASGQNASSKDQDISKYLEKVLFTEERLFYQLYGALFREIVLHSSVYELVKEASDPLFCHKIYQQLSDETTISRNPLDDNEITSLFHENERRDYVLVLPGGNYDFINHLEGDTLIESFYEAGYHSGLYNYREKKLRYPFLFEEGVRLIQKLRTHPKIRHLYVCGLEAGGHFALHLLEQANLELDGGILINPLVSSKREILDHQSFSNLLGNEALKAELKKVSLENSVHSAMPKVYLFHDMFHPNIVPTHSFILLEALQNTSVFVEAHFKSSNKVRSNPSDKELWMKEAISFLGQEI